MGFVREWKWRRLLIRQHDLTDCGPACLASVCRYYKKYVAVSKIRQLSKTDPNGTTLLGIVESATALGFEAKGIRADAIEKIATPAILHVIIDEKISHYIVLAKACERVVTVMDPAEGKLRRIGRKEFGMMWTGIAVLLSPAQGFTQSRGVTSLRKISMLASPFSVSLAWASLCAVIVSVLGITISVYVKEIVDVILVRKNSVQLNVASLLAIVVLMIQGILTIIKGRIVLITGKTINASLIMSYYRHVLGLPQSFFDSMRVGEVFSRVNDAAKITAFIHEAAVNLVVDVLIVVFSMTAMFYFNWQIALLVTTVIPVYCMLYFISNRINKQWQRKIAESAADLDASLVETLAAAATIRNLALQKYFGNKVSMKLNGLLNYVYKASAGQLNIQVTADAASKIIIVALLWVGSYYVMNGAMTTGELMQFYTLLLWFTVPLIYLIAANKIVAEAVISAERLFEILELERDKDGWLNVRADAVKIEMKDVWFAYGYNDYILKGINLTVNKGTIVGITGKSGSGKSTLASLLLRSHRTSQGAILMNEVNINDIESTCLCEMISVVSQKTDLFSTSIRENITIGLAYDEAKLNFICDKLGITQFVSAFNCGLDMMIAEQGNNLSGGQKQRIAIARAMYRNTPLLILDEATTAIDSLSEEKIMQTIEWYKNNGNTVIMITHSQSTLKICDNIVVLDNGVIR
jgi:ATP-binding cassette, subfamily C, bacteriocin exporter